MNLVDDFIIRLRCLFDEVGVVRNIWFRLVCLLVVIYFVVVFGVMFGVMSLVFLVVSRLLV